MKKSRKKKVKALALPEGESVSHGAYGDATLRSPDRGAVYFYLPGDSRQFVEQWQREEILRKVEWLFQSFGVVKECVRGIARHVVGKGISFSANTDDEEWNALAEAEVEAYLMAPDRVSLNGRRNGYEHQTFAVCQRIKQGEYVAAIVPNPRWGGEPCLVVYDATEVQTPPDQVGNPLFVDGFQLDADHCPIAIWVRGLDGNCKPIEWANVIHWMHADGVNQVRGISEFAQAVAPLMDTRELVRIVSKTAKQNSALAMVVKRLAKANGTGATGKIAALGGAITAGGGEAPPVNEQTHYEKVAGGGQIAYVGEEGDLKFVSPSSPSPLVEPFISKVLMRDGLASVGGASADFFWAVADLTGAGQRFVISRADVQFQTIGDGLIGHQCNPLVVRFLVHRMKTGKLRYPRVPLEVQAEITDATGKAERFVMVADDGTQTQWQEDVDGLWMSHIGWQLPARISIDRGDATVEIAQLNAGVETLATINDRRGRGWRPQIKQWFREHAYAKRVAVEMKAEWALPKWRESTPGAAQAQPEPEEKEDPKKPEPPADK